MYEKLQADFEDYEKKQGWMITELFGKNQSLETEKVKIKNQLKGLRGELEGERRQVKEKESDIRELLEKNKALELEREMLIEHWKTKVKEKEGQVQEVVNMYKELVRKNEALEMKKEILKRKLKEKEEEAETILKKYQDLEGDCLLRISAIEEECIPFFNKLREKYGDPASNGCASHHVHEPVNGNKAMRHIGEQPTAAVIKDSGRRPEEPSSIPTEPNRKQLDSCGQGTTCTQRLGHVEVMDIGDSDDDAVPASPVNGHKHDRPCEFAHEQVKRRDDDGDISVGKRRKRDLREVPGL